MDLVLKLPKDKPPFIGIQFPTDYSGKTTHDEWSLNHRQLLYQITIEFKGLTLNLKLTCAAGTCTYKSVEYNAQKLKNFILLTGKTDRFNFGHVVNTNDNHVVIKNKDNRLMVLMVDKFSVIQEY